MQFGDLGRAPGDGQEDKSGQNQDLAHHRQRQVDSPGACGFRVAAMKDQPCRGQTQQRERG